LKEINNALEMAPYFWEARRFQGEILTKEGMNQKALTSYKELIKHLKIPYLQYQCTKCGFKPNDLQWQCPQCRNWDSIELVPQKEEDQRPSFLSDTHKEKNLED